MNYNLEIYNIDNTYEYGLRITQCGMLSALGKVNSVPHVYDNYVLSFVTKGDGAYIIDGVINQVKTGDAFLTAPNVITSWTTQDNNPIQYIFMVINGPEHLKILSDVGLGLRSRIFKYLYKGDQSILQYLFSLYEAGKSNPTNEYKIIGYLYLIMDCISKNNKREEYDILTSQGIYFKKAVTFISDNYSNNINVLDIANFLNIDRTYLYKIFKTKTGVSPVSYLNNYRLEKAKWMIMHSDFSNTDIAVASGFYDYSHFSRAFKKRYGLSPGEFRYQIKSTHSWRTDWSKTIKTIQHRYAIIEIARYSLCFYKSIIHFHKRTVNAIYPHVFVFFPYM